MAQCTREQVDRWNAKLSNGFRLDLERFIVWNDKVATRSIELPDGKVLKADIGWTEVREEPRLGCSYQKTIGMMPRLSLSLWTPSSTPGMWCSRGLGAVVKITDNIYQKRNWNELAKFTAEWDEKRLLEEAKKHMRQAQMTRNERRYYRKKIIEQRLMGLGVLACCALVLWMCSTGVTVEDRDGTAVVLLAPLGLWLLFSKQILIY